jgi:hypothetical protein
MLPLHYHQLARLIHEERIAAALATRPEWPDTSMPAAGPRRGSRAGRRLRRWVARALHGLAVRVEPSSSAGPAPGSRQPAPTP